MIDLRELVFFSFTLVEAVLLGAASGFLVTLDTRLLFVPLIVIVWAILKTKKPYYPYKVIIYIGLYAISFFSVMAAFS